ncbi:44591_t:CDS:2, partial [Gigaspora margarita]
FILEGKNYKTCATCLIKKRANKKTLPDYNHNIEIISLKDLNKYVIELIDNIENNTGVSFTIQVDIDISDQNLSMKLIANMIIDSIEEGDAPRISTCYKNVGAFYFAYSQSNELAFIHIDNPASKIMVNHKHEILHNRSVDVTTPIEIRQEIKENIHLDPTDDNHINSAYSFLKSNQAMGCELCYELMTSQIIAIGFITPLYSKIKMKSEIHCDATYKTAKGRFELYGLICSFEDTTTEFDFIDLNFKPNLKELTNEICSQNLQQKVLDLIRVHFNKHPKILVNTDRQLLTPIEIHKNAYKIERWHLWAHFKILASKSVAVDAEKYYMIDLTHWHTDYPFLILNSNNSQNQPLNILDINTKLSTQVNIKNDLITINENEENFDPELRQLCKSKIVVLEHLVEHLNNELLANNLRHVSNVVDNMKCTFTIANNIESSQRKRQCSKTCNKSKP